MAENFHLGFVVDTTQLKTATVEATATSKAVDALGVSSEKLSTTTTQASTALEKLITQTRLENEAQRKLAADQKILDDAMRRGTITAQEHKDMTGQLIIQHKATAAAQLDAMRATMANTSSIQAQTGAQQASAAAQKTYGETTRQISGQLSANRNDILNLVNALRGQQGLGPALVSVGDLTDRLKGLLATKGGVILGVAAGVAALAYAYFKLNETLAVQQDRMVQLEGRLKNSLGSTFAAQQAMKELYQQTQETGLGFQAASDAFGRIARNNAAIGLTQREMLQLVETVQKLGAASGAGAGEMQAGMIQFGQALASGRLQGDELRSIMENFPALAKSIADNFENADGTIGITIGTLRRLGSEGELTGMKIAEAVLRATDIARKEFESLPTTMANANQKLVDAWDMALAELGKKLESSQFGQFWIGLKTGAANALLNAIGEIDIDKQIEEATKNVEAAKMGSPVGFAFSPYGEPAAIRLEEAEAIRILNGLLEKKAELEKEAAKASERELSTKKLALAAAAESQSLDLKSLEQKRRVEENRGRAIQEAIAALNEQIAKGPVLDADGKVTSTVDDLRKRVERLTESLSMSGAKLSEITSEFSKLRRESQDSFRARDIGGTGGEAIVAQAIAAQRQDAQQLAAASLSSYVGEIIRQRVFDNESALEQMQRTIDQSRQSREMVGAFRSELIEMETQNEAELQRLQQFGTLDTPEIEAWFQRYISLLKESKIAAQEASDAQRAYNAELRADEAMQMATASQDPLSQRRLRLELDKERVTRDMVDPAEIERTKAAMDSEFEAKELQTIQQRNREFEYSRDMIAEQLKLTGLTSKEYEIQMVLLRRRMELLKEGRDPESAEFNRALQQTEQLERERRAADEQMEMVDKPIRLLEDGIRSMEGTWKKSFEAIFTTGEGKARDIFLKGMGDIIKKISADMIYLIAIKPFEELANQMAAKLGSWIAQFLPGGGGAAAASSSGKSYDPTGKANGAIYTQYGLSAFANGAVFTNQIVSSPTLFKFASGTGLMGEAGPEAIMPLKRGADGKLGVIANGAGSNGGDVQIIVNDMRSGNASPVETQDEKQPNGKRVISLMIRDEMRSQLRSGNMDADMRNSYGKSRVLSRQ